MDPPWVNIRTSDMHAKQAVTSLHLALSLLVPLLVGCDGYIDGEIRNATDVPLRVEIHDDERVAMSQAVPPGRAIAFEEVLAGVSTMDLGQLRAFGPDGRLVFERDFTVTSRNEPCRIELTRSVEPETRVECITPDGGLDQAPGVSIFTVQTTSREQLNVYVGGTWLGYLSAEAPLSVEVSRDSGSITLTAVAASGARFERVLYPSDLRGPQEITIP